MSREIKFRVWHKPTKQFVKQDIFYLDEPSSIGQLSVGLDGTLIQAGMYDDYSAVSDPEDYAIQQYTGLKDKNGVEIYEGDYVLYPHKSGPFIVGLELSEEKTNWVQCEVKWKTGGLAAYWGHNDCNIVTFNFKQFIVVGNIFEGVDK